MAPLNRRYSKLNLTLHGNVSVCSTTSKKGLCSDEGGSSKKVFVPFGWGWTPNYANQTMCLLETTNTKNQHPFLSLSKLVLPKRKRRNGDVSDEND